ncbi:MAG TPA: hypothetical protein VKT33_07155 [Candidatus Angelobacter sp.]|nr:hypothetical protein [Candidatus Angelobacter sp.]
MTIFELIRQNAAPPQVMRAAARGSLSVPAEQMIEILVYLTRDAVYGAEAHITLAQWDEQSTRAVLANPATPREVLDYFWAEGQRRPSVMQALIENPATGDAQLMALATAAGREIIAILQASPRVRGSAMVMGALEANPEFVADDGGGGVVQEFDVNEVYDSWKQEHATEIAAEEGRAFELSEADEGEKQEIQAIAAPEGSYAAKVRAMGIPAEQRRLSPLQKITRMTVAERIKTAFGGDKEERAILIRDTSRVVQNAVLASPRLSDQEVENIAQNKTVQENVFRELARNRKFIRHYSVVRNLVNNPRCPLDLGLTLIKNLYVNDLHHLQNNKNIPDTLRKVAAKLYRDKKLAK